MKNSNQEKTQYPDRRQRLHELLIALVQQQDELELLDDGVSHVDMAGIVASGHDPARWLERNKRILNNYQALVRSAITLDALLESEQSELGSNSQY